MTIHTDNRRRWQVPYGIVTLWSAYVLMFLGGVYLLAREYAAVHHADAYANESILWDVSQLQRELLRLGLLLEHTQALGDPISAKTLANQLDLAWSTASATPGYVRNRPWLLQSRNCAGFTNTWTGFSSNGTRNQSRT